MYTYICITGDKQQRERDSIFSEFKKGKIQVLLICVYTHTHIHTHIHTYMHAYIHKYIHTYIGKMASHSSLHTDQYVSCYVITF